MVSDSYSNIQIETIPHFQSPETYLRGKSNSIVVISTM